VCGVFVKEKEMPPNRMVALLTPVVALAAGGVATWLADNLGIQVDAAELQAIFVAAIVAVLAPAAQWLYGSQKFERHQAELERLALKADTESAARTAEAEMEAAAAYEDEAEDDADDYDDDGHDDEYADDDEDDYDDYESAREEQPATY
jgi:hypothetical protein